MSVRNAYSNRDGYHVKSSPGSDRVRYRLCTAGVLQLLRGHWPSRVGFPLCDADAKLPSYVVSVRPVCSSLVRQCVSPGVYPTNSRASLLYREIESDSLAGLTARKRQFPDKADWLSVGCRRLSYRESAVTADSRFTSTERLKVLRQLD